MGKIEEFKEMALSSERIVFFGGAGVSTESGIPDYRSTGGLYSQKYKYAPETMLSHTFFVNNPEEFYVFYKDKLLHPEAKPNITHIKLAELEGQGRLMAVVTQNVDGLHQQAGSKAVDELHGSVHRNYCMQCAKEYSLEYIVSSNGVPVCDECGGIVRPDVVLYEEQLDSNVLSSAIEHISSADMLIIGGTSLAVYPAASLVWKFAGNKLVSINKTPISTPPGCLAITDSLGNVFSQL
ncbi:MAG: NAD-dependent protein deacylase [Eubacteriaceae bacterium]|nr:NAD-dependent protein deacylase [Eubacteriaceae bacterium]